MFVVMLYQVSLSNIHPDYSVDPPPTDTWSAVVEDDDALIVMMNRVAIASSQNQSHEYPVLDIVTGGIRATITVIGGQLYYTDPSTPNRSNIKVVADGALKLLHGSSFESVLQAEAEIESEAARSSAPYRPSVIGPRLRLVLWIVLFASIGTSLTLLWRGLTYRPRLVPTSEFVPGAIDEMSLRSYTGIYVDGYQEGGRVLELTPEGQFILYEMWHSAGSESFTLKQVESLSMTLGTQYGEPALMVEEFYLLQPRTEGRILMGGVLFEPHVGALGDIGTVQ
jgi:hypothetical protein